MSYDIFLLLQNGNKRNVVLEQSTAGSGTVTITKEGNYFLELVGGGSGYVGYTDVVNGSGSTLTHSGGNGGCFLGLTYLTTGTYSYTVGDAGTNSMTQVEDTTNVSLTKSAGSGGNSSFTGRYEYTLTATGATGATVSGTTNNSFNVTTEATNGTVTCKDRWNNNQNISSLSPTYMVNTDTDKPQGYYLYYGAGGRSESFPSRAGYIRLTYLKEV